MNVELPWRIGFAERVIEIREEIFGLAPLESLKGSRGSRRASKKQ